MATAEATEKLCLGCRSYLPLTAFRRRGDGRFHSRCKGCFAEYMRRYRHGRKLGFARAFSSAIARSRTDAQVTRLTALAVHRMGGLERLSEVFVEHLDACPLGSRARTTMLIAMVRLATVSDKQELRRQEQAAKQDRSMWDRENPLLDLTTKEELEADIDRYLRGRIHDLATGMGMKLVPIDDSA